MKECFLEINVDNLRSNFLWYKSQTKNNFICPMIKANAYGVGLEIVFNVLKSAGADHVGVVRLSEALAVRALDQNINILMFNPCDEDDFEKAIDLRITPVISSMTSLLALNKVLSRKKNSTCHVHLEIDTGMNRLGFKNENLVELFDFLKSQKKIKVAGVFSHFLKADDWPSAAGESFKQLRLFDSIVDKFKKLLSEVSYLSVEGGVVFHLSSSKALNMEGFSSSCNNEIQKYGLRPGLGLYGISQINDFIKPVVSLKAPIVDLKWISKGETVSYDGSWVASRNTLIGVLPVGYGDGYPRSLFGKSHVLIFGQSAPIIGKICMDFMMIDLTDIDLNLSFNGTAEDVLNSWKDKFSQKSHQEFALVFGGPYKGSSLPLEELSELAGIITYEFIVGLSSRIKRISVGNLLNVAD